MTGFPSLRCRPVPSMVVEPELMRWMKPPAASPVGLPAGDALHGLGAPEAAHVGEYLGAAGEEVAEEHGDAVQGVVLGRARRKAA